jgi:hypothetical protein
MLTGYDVSLNDIAKEIGRSGVTVRTWWRQGRIKPDGRWEAIPAKLSRRRLKKHVYVRNTKKLQDWCDKVKTESRFPKPRPSRAGRTRIRRDRMKKIDKLFEIFNDKTEARDDDKELAIWFYRCVQVLFLASRDKNAPRFPLLEGLEALQACDGTEWVSRYPNMEKTIKQLPSPPGNYAAN